MPKSEDSPAAESGSRAVPAHAARLGPGLTVRGDISGSEDLVLQGAFRGRLDLPGKTVHIDRGAEVAAEIEAGEIILSGALDGNIRASGRVVLNATAAMKGDISATQISIQDGARFKGTLQIKKD
jgi:cytoskeletal protein CcmA (bactofilin family)